jgi:uncharacterized protein YbaP (TraB family)
MRIKIYQNRRPAHNVHKFDGNCYHEKNSTGKIKDFYVDLAFRMRVIPLLLILVFVSAGIAQEKSLMWEISGNGLETPSYLYGTMHISDKRIFRFNDSVMIAFKSCNAYAGEIIIDKESKKAAKKDASKYLFMSGDTTLSMLIGDSGLAKVRKKLKGKLRLLSGMINRIKPFFTLGLISEGSFRHNRSTSLDEYFQQLARKNKLGLIGIETISEQMSAIDKIPLVVQAEMLLYEVSNPPDQTEKDAGEMLNTYLDQDIAKLHDYLEDESTPDALNQYVLVDRNFIMADRIEKFVKFQPTFIGVGAAHLAGEKGLLSLLRQKGFTIRAVIAPFKT